MSIVSDKKNNALELRFESIALFFYKSLNIHLV